MAGQGNNILEKLEAALSDPETPRWAIPVLLCIRDDHERLRAHLAQHGLWGGWVQHVVVNVLTAVTVAIVFWLLAGQLPAIFH